MYVPHCHTYTCRMSCLERETFGLANQPEHHRLTPPPHFPRHRKKVLFVYVSIRSVRYADIDTPRCTHHTWLITHIILLARNSVPIQTNAHTHTDTLTYARTQRSCAGIRSLTVNLRHISHVTLTYGYATVCRRRRRRCRLFFSIPLLLFLLSYAIAIPSALLCRSSCATIDNFITDVMMI